MAAVTCVPLWVTVADHPCDTFCPAANGNPRLHELIAPGPLVIVTVAVNPVLQSFVTYATRHPAAGETDGETDGDTDGETDTEGDTDIDGDTDGDGETTPPGADPHTSADPSHNGTPALGPAAA